MSRRVKQNGNIIYHLEVKTDTSTYPITIGEQISDSYKVLLRGYPKVFLLTNDTILDLYNENLIRQMEDDLPFLSHMTVQDGERYKNMKTLNDIYEGLSSKELGRDGCVVALGGGVIGDLAGFAAATYMRGVDYVQIPTTLLAMVDSSIGGKTGVNLTKAKNTVGSFHHPKAVFCDLCFLDTLPVRQFNAGLMEVIKYGLILDEAFYRFILANRNRIAARDRDVIAYLVYRCCQLKARIVGQDETDKGIRAILNFGHTVGHALESYTGYRVYLHGEAVALGGLAIICHLVEKGAFEIEFLEEFKGVLDFFRLPISLPSDFDVDAILRHISYDKKKELGTPRWVTLKQVGSAVWGQLVNLDEIRHVLRGLQIHG